jgi:carboxyl-terminal processing protease
MNIANKVQSTVTTLLLIVLGIIGGYYFGVQGYEVKVKDQYKDIQIIDKDKEANIPETVSFSKFWLIWDMVSSEHIKKPFNPSKLLDGAIAGMVAAIDDPYTIYLNTERNTEAKSDLNGEYEGIGAQLGFDENNILIIVAPLDGSPAQALGVKAGDKILKIDGKTTQGISVEEAVNKIRGPGGTTVTLNLFRESEKDPFDLTITRSMINVESVKWEDKGDGVAYVRLSRFGENTNKEWDAVMSQVKYQMPNLKSIVLDVRNNPGGYLDSAVHISSDFVKSGVIVTQETSDGDSFPYPVSNDKEGLFTDGKVKLIVLINKGSASASEIVAAALKEKASAVLVGERSFGKGSVQKSEEFKDGSALHVTIAKWLTPNNNWIDSANSKFEDSVYNEKDERGNDIVGGLKPDEFVAVSEEDTSNNVDSQLNKALELLKYNYE